MNSRCCIFIGPSRGSFPIPSSVVQFPPAALGSVFQATVAGFAKIGIVDGYFGNVPSVWHKEILYALSQGVAVFGASSMGALRAAELWRFGMRGVGRVFRLYRRNIITDDDEVCLIHGPLEANYVPFTCTMIEIRYTLRKMRRAGVIDRKVETHVIGALKNAHFSNRNVDFIREEFAKCSEAEGQVIFSMFQRMYVRVKEDDAARLVSELLGFSVADHKQTFVFPRTSHWIRQFERDTAHIPRLGEDPSLSGVR